MKKSETINDEILTPLLKRYFQLLKQEKYPKTKTITAELDKLEEQIRSRKKDLDDNKRTKGRTKKTLTNTLESGESVNKTS